MSTDPDDTRTSSPGADTDVSVIGEGIEIEGKIEGSTDLTVRGRVRGEIRLKGSLRVDQEAEINATINAAEVEVAGTTEGTIVASRRLELEKSARVSGRITAPVIIVHDGAELNGNVTMSRSHEKKTAGE